MRGFRLLRMRGIDLRVHWSLAIIVVLVMSSIAVGQVPTDYPRWGQLAAWSTGFGVAFGLIASIALHEFSHALVALRVGVPVPQVTLFAFGGIAQLGDRPRRATHEFAITIAGLLMSLVLGVVLLLASSGATIGQTASAGSVVALVARTLGEINVVLAVFNCLPGAPLDGGRLLHSVVWRITGSEARATEIASRSGQLLGTALATVGLLMLFGFTVPFFGSGAGGVWLMLIGWFIAGVARAERVDAGISSIAGAVPIGRITRPLTGARADTPLDEFADEVLLPRGAHALPVIDDGRYVGIASLRDALKVAEPLRAGVTVSSVMTPWEQVHTLDAGASIGDAVRAFAAHEVHQLPVVDDDGRVVGFVHRDDMLGWLQLHATPDRVLEHARS